MIPFGVRPDFELKATLAQASVQAETFFLIQAVIFNQGCQEPTMR